MSSEESYEFIRRSVKLRGVDWFSTYPTKLKMLVGELNWLTQEEQRKPVRGAERRLESLCLRGFIGVQTVGSSWTET